MNEAITQTNNLDEKLWLIHYKDFERSHRNRKLQRLLQDAQGMFEKESKEVAN